jgi:hypothetical protein
MTSEITNLKGNFIILESFKTLFCLPNKLRISRIFNLQRYISLEEYEKEMDNQDKLHSNFFIYEVMRLFAFRYLMCLKSNTENSIEVCLFRESENLGIFSDSLNSPKLLISRLDYPVSINEKSFCFNPDDDSGRIPKGVLRKWFDNKPELLHDTVKDLLYDNGYDTEIKLKDALLQCIKDCGVRYDNELVYWMNSIIDKSRRYF